MVPDAKSIAAYTARSLRATTEAQRFMRALNRGKKKYSLYDLLDDVEHCRYGLDQLREEVPGPLSEKMEWRFNWLLRNLSVIEIAISGLAGVDYGDGSNVMLSNCNNPLMNKPIKMPELPLGRRQVKRVPA
jgi:hypothetical protein